MRENSNLVRYHGDHLESLLNLYEYQFGYDETIAFLDRNDSKIAILEQEVLSEIQRLIKLLTEKLMHTKRIESQQGLNK